jgi:hypothetical protein
MGIVTPRGGKQRVSSNGPRKRVGGPLSMAQGHEVVWKQVSSFFEAARPYEDCSFVYIVGEEDDGPIKIGVSKDPISRLRQMQTGNPRRLRIEYVLMGDIVIEKFLHDLWRPFAIFASRKRGKVDAAPETEWFRSEVRAPLLPIIDLAVAGQIERLGEKTDVTTSEMAHVIRIAHAAHGVELEARSDVAHLLGPLSVGWEPEPDTDEHDPYLAA